MHTHSYQSYIHSAIEWLQSNVEFSNNIARPRLFANMMTKNISTDRIPPKWLLSHGTLEYVCGDLNATQTYVKRFPMSFINDIYDPSVLLMGASSMVMRWIWGILPSEKHMLTIDRIVDLDATDLDSIKKLIWVIGNLPTCEVVKYIGKYLPVPKKVLRVCSEHIDGFMSELDKYKGISSQHKID